MTETTNDLNILKEKYKDTKLYKTSDIALAATLILLGKSLLFMEPLNKKQFAPKSDIFHFVFEDDAERESIVLKFTTDSGDLKVSPNPFRSTMKYLKEQTRNYSK
jgi:hypothetical protein